MLLSITSFNKVLAPRMKIAWVALVCVLVLQGSVYGVPSLSSIASAHRSSIAALINHKSHSSEAEQTKKEVSGAALAEPSEPIVAGPSMPLGLETCFKELEGTAPMYELVVARFSEPLGWLASVPHMWAITVYNKGGEKHPLPPVPSRNFTVINLPNKGREAGSYAHHIATRYSTLAEYTVFSQGDPFVHSRHFLDLLRHPAILGQVQTMSLVYLAESAEAIEDFVTPHEVINTYRKHAWYRSERLSLRTMNSVYFHDNGTVAIMRQYHQLHKVPLGTNIVAHHLDGVGLQGWVPHKQEVGSFAYGGIFGVHQTKIQQHPLAVYENLESTVSEHDLLTYVQERCWLMMLGGHAFEDL